MRNKRLLQFLVVLCALWWALPALAGTVSLVNSQVFTVSVTTPSGDTDFDRVTISSLATGYAYYPDQSPADVSNTNTFFPTASTSETSVTAQLVPTTNLLTTASQTTYGGGTQGNFSLSQQYVGTAPSPSSGGFPTGYLSQGGYYAPIGSFDVLIDNIADGTYTVDIDRTILSSQLLTLANNTTDPNYFYSLYCHSVVNASLTALGSGRFDPNSQDILTFDVDGSFPTPLADFSMDPGTGWTPFSLSLTDVTAADGNLLLHVEMNTELYGDTVPLPGTLPLFGSGLAGLLLMGRRFLRR